MRKLGFVALLLVGFLVGRPAQAEAQVRVWISTDPASRALLPPEAHTIHDFGTSQVITLPASQLDEVERTFGAANVEIDPPRPLIAPTDDDSEPTNGQLIPYGLDTVQARDVWDQDRDSEFDAGAPDGSGVTVCIIDTGVQHNHPDLADVPAAGISQLDQHWNYDPHGHGTHIAGIVAAVNNELGVLGASPGVSLFVVKMFTADGTMTHASDLVAAVQACADAGARVISMSFGFPQPCDHERAILDELYADGILLIAAAGNNGSEQMDYPASYDSVISVAAVDSEGTWASFSQHNPQVELAAPGVDVLSTTPDGFSLMSGTSMAAPHVAATAALLWGAHPEATAQEVRTALTCSAADYGAPGRDDYYGFGLVQAADAIAYLQGGSLENTGFEGGLDGWLSDAATPLPFAGAPEGDHIALIRGAAGITAMGQTVAAAGEAHDAVKLRLDAGARRLPPGAQVGARVTFRSGDRFEHVLCLFEVSDQFQTVGCTVLAPFDYDSITVTVGMRRAPDALLGLDRITLIP